MRCDPQEKGKGCMAGILSPEFSMSFPLLFGGTKKIWRRDIPKNYTLNCFKSLASDPECLNTGLL